MAGKKRQLEASAGASKKAAVKEEEIATSAAHDSRTRAERTNLIERDGKTCTHQVYHPPEKDEEQVSDLPPPVWKGAPARVYPFKIDPFQETAINALEAGDDVLVAAHTSAGKTVIAEYSFGMALRDGGRVVYTSPLKALSNQKYRDLREEFEDVGLMTGDVTINPTASCLVMTTEILRSMLYNGSEVIREVQLLVYDEIHYMRDRERGVVWEESIILAPKSCKIAFLSATIPNAGEFASWVARTHGRSCHVVYTDYRPTPLQHFIYPSGGENMYMIVDEKSNFRDDNFTKAVAEMQEAKQQSQAARGGGKKGAVVKKETDTGESSSIFKVVKMVIQRNLDPVIVFSFSKTEVEALSAQMVSMDINSSAEKTLVEQVFRNALDCLGDEDRKLPQVNEILPMLKRGIGIHHSGLLPLVKEVIEVLFGEGLLKVLFATETFSTGLNMPAKTVVFNSTRKFDGYRFRDVTSGEYIQMSGRAGRRGLDDRGVVILMMDGRLDPAVAKDMLHGAPDALNSEFHLGYNMLLNLATRSDAAGVEDLLRRSFRQFQMEAALPNRQAALSKLEAERDAIQLEDEASVAEYLLMLRQLASLRDEQRQLVNSPKHVLPFLQPGRLARVLPDGAAAAPRVRKCSSGPVDLPVTADPEGHWATVVNFERLGTVDADGQEVMMSKKRSSSYAVDVLVNCSSDSREDPTAEPGILGARADGQGVPQVVRVNLSRLEALSSVRVYVPKELQSIESRRVALRTLGEVESRFPKGLPPLDPETDMKVDDKDYRKLSRKVEQLENALLKHELSGAADLLERLRLMESKADKQEQVRLAEAEVKAAKKVILRDELKARMRILKRLEYIDSEGLITVKGRFAASLKSSDELVTTELVFGGIFKDLNIVQTAALVSCLVWQEKGGASGGGGGAKVAKELEGPLAELKSIAKRVAKVSADCKLQVDVDEYVAGFRPEMMDVIAAWASGSSFRELLKMTKVFEGSLVRAIRQLHEVLVQLSGACQAIGDVDLQAKFDETCSRVKRDIVFAASLYL